MQEIMKEFVFIITYYLYVNNACWITIVKRQVGSDFSGLQGQALARFAIKTLLL